MCTEEGSISINQLASIGRITPELDSTPWVILIPRSVAENNICSRDSDPVNTETSRLKQTTTCCILDPTQSLISDK